jgi:hypothetical protein
MTRTEGDVAMTALQTKRSCSIGALLAFGVAAAANAQAPSYEVSACRPVVPAVTHRVTLPFCEQLGDPFLVNRRLAPIEGGFVPCVNVDTLVATRCPFAAIPEFSRTPGQSTGHWIEGPDGRPYAIVGQPVALDGSPGSAVYIVGTIADANGTVPCIGASGRDSAGVAAGLDLASSCVVETAGSPSNATGVLLRNFATRNVPTSSLTHPDHASTVSVDANRSIAWYTGEGAALNDPAGIERDSDNVYLGTTPMCHMVAPGGVQVPAAKRPATRSLPRPAAVVITSPIQWSAFNPYVTIANDTCLDQRPASAPAASFEVGVGLVTVSVDARASTGDIVRYVWDFDWTTNPRDAVTSSPTADLPLAAQGPVNSGWITLTVVTRDGRAATARQHVNFKSRIP